jgi:hypothetical protein
MAGITSRYGLCESTGGPAARSAAALIRAFGGLVGHHELAHGAVTDAFADFDEAMAVHDAASDPTDRPPIQRSYLEILRARIEQFDEARTRLIGQLEPLREPASELIVEVQRLFSAADGPTIDVEAPAAGNDLEIPAGALSGAGQVKLASQAHSWTRAESYPHALLAGKACYLLSELISPTNKAAAEFGSSCERVEREVDAFLAEVFTPLAQ